MMIPNMWNLLMMFNFMMLMMMMLKINSIQQIKLSIKYKNKINIW